MKGKVIYISNLCPSYISYFDIISKELSKIFKLKKFLNSTPILSIDTNSITEALQSLGIIQKQLDQDRGNPGCVVRDIDQKLLLYNPFSQFHPNEIIAWEDENNTKRYGIVANDDENDKDSKLLQSIRIKIGPNSYKNIPSSNVHIFETGKKNLK